VLRDAKRSSTPIGLGTRRIAGQHQKLLRKARRQAQERGIDDDVLGDTDAAREDLEKSQHEIRFLAAEREQLAAREYEERGRFGGGRIDDPRSVVEQSDLAEPLAWSGIVEHDFFPVR